MILEPASKTIFNILSLLFSLFGTFLLLWKNLIQYLIPFSLALGFLQSFIHPNLEGTREEREKFQF
jgi:hypothetical protein